MDTPVIGEVMAGGAAENPACAGDVVLRVGDTAIVDGQQLRETIRASAPSASGSAAVMAPQRWQLLRAGQPLELQVTPELKQEAGTAVARIGAYVGAPPEFVTVRYGPLDGLWQGVVRTWEVSLLTLKMIGKMVIGEASLKI